MSVVAEARLPGLRRYPSSNLSPWYSVCLFEVRNLSKCGHPVNLGTLARSA
jgi:hypothetical protein